MTVRCLRVLTGAALVALLAVGCLTPITGGWHQHRTRQPYPPAGMVLIPAGDFTMGDACNDPYANDKERPTHTVYVSAFWMDRYEVSKAQWESVRTWALTNGYPDIPDAPAKGTNHPVHSINWHSMVKWCNARSEQEGRPACYTVTGAVYRVGQLVPDCKWSARGYRLPTESEWEKAARGGTPGHRYPWSDTDNIDHSRANYCSANQYDYDTSLTRNLHPAYSTPPKPSTSPVGSFAPNGYGLYDMAGNAAECCGEWGPSDYSDKPVRNPTGADPTFFLVCRGGSWADHASECRVSRRSETYASYISSRIGFRAVLRDRR